MVYKVCKGGVRSGNTLRGLHTLRTRRYAGQACIIGQSNLSRKQMSRLLEESTDDDLVSSTLTNTDVILSLNKKRRWNLPATVNHMIKAGQFSDAKAMVSVLERHKLKRRANCVGFTCNKQTPHAGTPAQKREQSETLQGQKKYFSFNPDYLDMDMSRRQWKKRMVEELLKIKRDNKVHEKRDRRTDMKTVEVVTVQGYGGFNKRKSYKETLTSSKPQYKLEVFYPCPQSCSLTFNPKYTDVVMAQNNEGQMEIRSNVSYEKNGQKKQRKRFTAADFKSFSSESAYCDEDVEEMWREEYENSISAENHDQICASFAEQSLAPVYPETGEKEDNSGAVELHKVDRFSESVFACLVDQAEQAKAQWRHVNTKLRRRQKSGRYKERFEDSKKSTISDETMQIKNHIRREIQIPTTSETVKNTKTTQETEAKGSDSTEEPVLVSAPVILSTSEVHPESLRSRFGPLYAEADCHPRRFCINITEDVANLMSSYRSVRSTAAYTTFIIFTSKGVYDEGLETYGVTVNCAGTTESKHTTYSLPQGPITLDSAINSIIGNLFDLKEIGHLNFSDTILSSTASNSASFFETVLEKMNIQVDNFFISDQFINPREAGTSQEKCRDVPDDFAQSLIQLAEDSENGIFCDICYESINPTQIDATQGTQLTACGHMFCDTCWKTHLRTRIKEGATCMTCPGYQCDAKLGMSTLLSLLHVTEVALLLRRVCEEEVETCLTAKWCPSPTCGRVIRLRTKRAKRDETGTELGADPAVQSDVCMTVTCGCGESWCFACLSPAHWPAGCEQAQDYLDKVSSIKPVKETREEEPETLPVIPAKPKYKPPPVFEVEGRLCPRCRRFIQKNGGCLHMSCKCGYQFCWGCLGTWRSHETCIPNAATVREFTRRVKIRHVEPESMVDAVAEIAKENQQSKNGQPPTRHASRRYKATMYQKALQQRLSAENEANMRESIEALAAKICRTSGKDLQFKKAVLIQCGLPESQIPDVPEEGEIPPQQFGDLARLPLAHHVIKYLMACREAHLALRHVTEYTFVLLQDCPVSLDKKRAARVASDLVAFCSFSLSVLQAGGKQDVRTALRRLADIQTWSSRALDALLATVHRLK